jgi:hypothetical protein
MTTNLQSESFLFDKEDDLSDMSQEEFDLWVKSQIDQINGMIRRKPQPVRKEVKSTKKFDGFFSSFRFIFA